MAKKQTQFLPIYQRIRDFDKTAFLVGNQIGDDEEWKFEKLREVQQMPSNDDKKIGFAIYPRLYRGTSAYADHVDADLLSYIHLKTKLDDAVIKVQQRVGKILF